MHDQPNSSTHPLLPPTTEEDRISWLRLLRSRRVGVSTFYRLMQEHGTAQNALDALPSIAAAAGVKGYTTFSTNAAEREINAGSRLGARLVFIGQRDYPTLLSDISSAPPMLWVRGDISALTRPSVALVGARNASSLGTRMSRALASGLGEAGFTVISGLARGVDTAAHLASLDTGTVAVLAGGVDVLYPAENTKLAEDILEKGALVSEQPIGMAPIARHFPVRNRIISGISRATVIVEAAARSGSLITARDALDQGRDVLAVPGHPFDARASGANMLIRDGAILIRNVDDIIEVVGAADQLPLDLPQPEDTKPQGNTANLDSHPKYSLKEAAKPERSLQQIAALHQRILDRLGPSPVAEDQLMRDVGLSAGRGLSVLTDLEIDGQIRRAPGGLVSRA